jgi:hypothetical protein
MKNFGYFVVLFAVILSVSVANASLVAWYQMNDAIGTGCVTDSSGHSYTAGMAWDTGVTPTAGYTGSSLNFTGDSMRIWTPTNMGATGDFTWSLQIKTTQTANGGLINHAFERYDNDSANLSQSCGLVGGKVRFYGAGKNWIQTQATVNDGQWHTITVVNTWENVLIYIDGINAALEYQWGPGNNWFPGLASATDTFKYWFGACHYGSFVGEMKDVRIFDNKLTDAEVLALVPEPATMTLLGLGLILFRRKQN